MGRRGPGLLAKGKSHAFKSMERKAVFGGKADAPGPGELEGFLIPFDPVPEDPPPPPPTIMTMAAQEFVFATASL